MDEHWKYALDEFNKQIKKIIKKREKNIHRQQQEGDQREKK